MYARTYKPVWHCIYCDAPHSEEAPLSKEHIIPKSLDGILVLPRSSCSSCGKETGKFEEICTHEIFGAYRLAANFPTRNPKKRPTHLNLNTHTGLNPEREEVWESIEDYPIISAVMPEMEIPGILRSAPSTDTFQCNLRILNLMKDNETRAKYEAEGKQLEVSRSFHITPFAKLLAKIGYSFAVAEHGIKKSDSFLTPLILGESLNLPDYVGGTSTLTPSDNIFLGNLGTKVVNKIEHYLNCEIVKAIDGIEYLTVHIRLLQSCAPSYRIVVAKYSKQQ